MDAEIWTIMFAWFAMMLICLGAGYYAGSHNQVVNVQAGNYTLDVGPNMVLMYKAMSAPSCDSVTNYDCSYVSDDGSDYENGGCQMLLKSRITIRPQELRQ